MIVFLFLSGGTPLPQQLLKNLESPYYETSLDPDKKYDAIIVLGGYASKDSKGITGIDAGGAFDRILTGIELAKREKGESLFIGIGNSPNNVIKEWMKSWDLIDIPYENLGNCDNTYDESQAVKKLAGENGWGKVLLVTSAWHMPRAEAVFISSGIKVTPVACDFKSTPINHTYYIPQSGQLSNMQLFLQEKIGWIYYRLKGWIQHDALPK
tara:strand:- start:1076 stop:1708 length:633 start_codon:yes stop_codon:yes gene_type:complete